MKIRTLLKTTTDPEIVNPSWNQIEIALSQIREKKEPNVFCFVGKGDHDHVRTYWSAKEEAWCLEYREPFSGSGGSNGDLFYNINSDVVGYREKQKQKENPKGQSAVLSAGPSGSSGIESDTVKENINIDNGGVNMSVEDKHFYAHYYYDNEKSVSDFQTVLDVFSSFYHRRMWPKVIKWERVSKIQQG